MERKYYTLLVKEDGKWMIEFGDYDRSLVLMEQVIECEHRRKKKDTKVITSGDTQEEINKAVDELNEEGNK